MGEASSESASRVADLRKHFAFEEDSTVTTESLTLWLQELARLTTKKEIYESSEDLATFMVEVKGYSTGEGMLEVERVDIEEARELLKLKLTDVGIRTIVRYMEKKEPQLQEEAKESPSKSQVTSVSSYRGSTSSPRIDRRT